MSAVREVAEAINARRVADQDWTAETTTERLSRLVRELERPSIAVRRHACGDILQLRQKLLDARRQAFGGKPPRRVHEKKRGGLDRNNGLAERQNHLPQVGDLGTHQEQGLGRSSQGQISRIGTLLFARRHTHSPMEVGR